MAEPKTTANTANVEKFIDALDDTQQVADSLKLVEIMGNVSGEKPVMWGSSIIGFGSMPLKYASGRELYWPRIAFSPRKGKTTLYLTMDAQKLTADYKDLGKFKIGKGCIYITKLSDVDEAKLIDMIQAAYNETNN